MIRTRRAVDEGCEPDDLITVKVDGYRCYDGKRPDSLGHRTATATKLASTCTPVPPTHCLILKQGWNLVSWNIDTPNDSIMILAKDVMDNVDVILSFEQGAQTYDPKLPEFSTLLFADHFHGFWFRMNAEDTLCRRGADGGCFHSDRSGTELESGQLSADSSVHGPGGSGFDL